jgi:hypothetical protein
MGFDTYWFDDNDNVDEFDFSGCLFLTESQVEQNIPLVKNSKYILHHCNNEKYIDAGCEFINLCNYVADCEDGIGFDYEGSTVERLGNLCFYDDKNKALYQPWATDLLPEEIDIESFIPYDSSRQYVNYIGSVWHDNIMPKMKQFKDVCSRHGKTLKVMIYVPPEKVIEFIKDSYITIDIRGDWQQLRGYLPCRIFKNISYGKFVGTNSEHVYKIFGNDVPYKPDLNELFEECEHRYASLTKSQFQKSMLNMKENHTYINRAKRIFEILGVDYD